MTESQWEFLYKIYCRAFLAARYKTAPGDLFIEHLFVNDTPFDRMAACALGVDAGTDMDKALLTLREFKTELHDMLDTTEDTSE